MCAKSNVIHNYVIVSSNKMLYTFYFLFFRNIKMDQKKVLLHEFAFIHTGDI